MPVVGYAKQSPHVNSKGIKISVNCNLVYKDLETVQISPNK